MNTPLLIAIISGSLVLLAIVAYLLLKPKPVAQRLCGGCRKVLGAGWNKCLFCGWELPAAIPRLEFVGGPLTGQTFPLHEQVTTIGSVAGNTIVLSDPGVSRKHIGIRKSEQGYELADLGSTNGVYVNGYRVPTKILVPNDILRVGSSEFVFRIG